MPAVEKSVPGTMRDSMESTQVNMMPPPASVRAFKGARSRRKKARGEQQQAKRQHVGTQPKAQVVEPRDGVGDGRGCRGDDRDERHHGGHRDHDARDIAAGGDAHQGLEGRLGLRLAGGVGAQLRRGLLGTRGARRMRPSFCWKRRLREATYTSMTTGMIIGRVRLLFQM